MWIKIGRFLSFCVRSTVLTCQDILNFTLLCSFNQGYGDCCPGEVSDVDHGPLVSLCRIVANIKLNYP